LSRQTARKPPDRSVGHKILLPENWPPPRGYANGILARGDMVFVGGVVGWDANEKFPTGFVAQTRQALEDITAILAAGGAGPEHLVRLTWYVCDMDEYLAARPELSSVYREVIGEHYPAMALVEVGRLVEPDARVEIEATAVVPPA
jgi:enamine deaminase RidA (YjgF/YER057c/UK114 family)